jgi:hypothetical protein
VTAGGRVDKHVWPTLQSMDGCQVRIGDHGIQYARPGTYVCFRLGARTARLYIYLAGQIAL